MRKRSISNSPSTSSRDSAVLKRRRAKSRGSTTSSRQEPPRNLNLELHYDQTDYAILEANMQVGDGNNRDEEAELNAMIEANPSGVYKAFFNEEEGDFPFAGREQEEVEERGVAQRGQSDEQRLSERVDRIVAHCLDGFASFKAFLFRGGSLAGAATITVSASEERRRTMAVNHTLRTAWREYKLMMMQGVD
jgi:hypothetical protein